MAVSIRKSLMGETQKCEVDLRKVMFRAGSKRTCSCGGVDKEKPYRMDAKMRS